MKFLYPPLFPYVTTQYFGENKACYRMVNGKIETITKDQTAQCPVGYQSLYSLMLGHNGLDMISSNRQTKGLPVFASHDGYVVEIQTEEARGLGIGILSDKKYHCTETGHDEYYKSRYWHLMSFNVTHGQYVKRGDWIGIADNTGASSASHCHFEVKPVSFLTSNPQYVKDTDLKNVLQDAGYLGAIDPSPYLIKPEIINVPIYYGNSGDTVNELQTVLKYLGYFPKEQTVTNYFGEITRQAVYDFQLQNVSLSWYERYWLRGRIVGPKTLAKLYELSK